MKLAGFITRLIAATRGIQFSSKMQITKHLNESLLSRHVHAQPVVEPLAYLHDVLNRLTYKPLTEKLTQLLPDQ